MTNTILALLLGYACGAMSMLTDQPWPFLAAAVLATLVVAFHGGKLEIGRGR